MQKIYELDMDKEFAEFMKEKDEQEIKDSDFEEEEFLKIDEFLESKAFKEFVELKKNEENINYFEAVFASWRYDEYYEEEI